MTRDDITKMAREAGVLSGYDSPLFQRFAALVAAAERKECLEAMEKTKFIMLWQPSYGNIRTDDLAQIYEAPYSRCVIAIKARGEE